MVELEFELGLTEAKVSHVITAQHGLTRDVLLHEARLEASQSSFWTPSVMQSVPRGP